MTEVKPPSMQLLHSSKVSPWSRCTADGQIKARGLLGIDDSRLDELHQIDVLGVGAGALGDLKDQRSALFDRGLGDALNDFHVVDVESADGVAAIVGFLKHLSRGNESHNKTLLYMVWDYYTSAPVENQDTARKRP